MHATYSFTRYRYSSVFALIQLPFTRRWEHQTRKFVCVNALQTYREKNGKSITETIARILQPYNIRVSHKPITTLRRLHTNVKDKDKPEDRQGAEYKIKCCDCQASYIGETGRNLSTRLTEHKRATRNGDVNHHIAEHHLQTKVNIKLTGTLRHV